MKTELLLDIVKAIEIVPEEQFNMGTWWLKTECKTVGCAIGHYCHQNPNIALKYNSRCGTLCLNDMCDISLLGYTAVSKYLDITRNQALYLFEGFQYYRFDSSLVTKAEVISRILKFIEDNSPPATKQTKVTLEELVAV